MKKFNLLAAIMLVLNSLSAQIAITNAYFPASGDTLRIAADQAPQNVQVTPPGGPYEWDYSSLSAALEQEIVFRPAAEGTVFDDFQTAELFTSTQGGGETYYNISSTSFEVLGFNGPNPAGFGFPTLFKFTNPIPERHAPLNFPAIFNSSSAVLVPFSIADIPGGILDSLGVPFLPDSLRIRVTTERNDFVDAYGNLSIPGGTYPVLREKRTEFRETRLDAKVPFLGWQDITDLVLGGAGGGGGFGAGLGKDTVITYVFFSNEAKEAIAELTMDDSGANVQQASFKNNGVINSTSSSPSATATVQLSPNPATAQVKFELKNFKPGNYTLQLFSTEGSLMDSRILQLNDNHTVSMDLSALSAGAYFYRIADEKNRPLKTGQLIKVNP
jgi:hypothetical protein